MMPMVGKSMDLGAEKKLSTAGSSWHFGSVHVNHNSNAGFLTTFVTLFTDVDFKAT